MAEARQAAELEDHRRRVEEEYERAKIADAERVLELARDELTVMGMPPYKAHFGLYLSWGW